MPTPASAPAPRSPSGAARFVLVCAPDNDLWRALMAGGAAAVSSGNSPAETGDYSGTNNQVSGVDEVDLVKTDGQHLFVLAGSIFHYAAVLLYVLPARNGG